MSKNVVDIARQHILDTRGTYNLVDTFAHAVSSLAIELDAARAEVAVLKTSRLTPEELAALEDAVDCFEGELLGTKWDGRITIAGDALDKLRKARGT